MEKPGTKKDGCNKGLPILLGLLCAQLIATAFVWQSNLCLYQQAQALAGAGWFVVPTPTVAESFKQIRHAVFGGVFFTLSIGAGLTLLTWVVLHLGQLNFKNRRFFTFAVLSGWLGLAAAVNSSGTNLFATLFAVMVPAATAFGWWLYRSMSGDSRPGGRFQALPVIVLLALTAIWSTQLKGDLFLNIRDYVLLSNPLGRSVNDFYYRNTLYAAESFKSFQQKMIRCVRLDGLPEDAYRRSLIRALIARDILPVDQSAPADLMVTATGTGHWRFQSSRGDGITVQPQAFFKNPGEILKTFSHRTDPFAPLRKVVFLGLLIGFPCLLYTAVYSAMRLAAGLVLAPDQATLCACLLCLFLGIGLFVPMLGSRTATVPKDELNSVLQNAPWPRRVAALHQIEKQKLEIAAFPDYRGLLDSPLVVERYWLARTLGFSSAPETYRDLLVLARDNHPNVVCQAFDALGRRRNRSAVEIIKKAILRSDHWYAQTYGYKAMRRLGWRQGL